SEADARAQAEAVDAVFGVGLELVAPGIDARPVGALREGELVAERGDVDPDPRIRVPVPGAADAVTGLEQGPVGDPRFVQLDRGADAGEPGADDRDLEIRLRFAAHDSVSLRPSARASRA